jgi:hypothetical protein
MDDHFKDTDNEIKKKYLNFLTIFILLQMGGYDRTVLCVILSASEQGGPHGVGAPADDGVVAVGEQGQVERGGIWVDYLFSIFIQILSSSDEKLVEKITFKIQRALLT